jgi:shikimate dehydrogenase
MKHYGLLGKSLSHSFSKGFFTNYFLEHQIDADYSNFELNEIEEVQKILQSDLAGLNVTFPYKESIIPYLDEVSEEARIIGAVNTIQFVDEKSFGHNTDAFGFAQSIKPFFTNLHERALIFGTGGASKAVAYVLTNLGVQVYFISSSKKGASIFSYDDLNEHMLQGCKLWVNCTPIGTYPNVADELPIPWVQLSEDHLIVDLVYNPPKSQFLLKAQEHGATILNGESMLKEQALKSWEIWKGNL